MSYRAGLAVSSLGLLLASLATAQEPAEAPPAPAEVQHYRQRLKQAALLASQRRWGEALTEYQRLCDEAGEVLLPLDKGPSACTVWLQLRRCCQLELAQLPVEGQAVYRQRQAVLAERQLRRAQAERDPLLLRQVVDQSFATPAAAQALNWLGDLAFEEGDFVQARFWWSCLAAPLGVWSAEEEKEIAAALRALRVPTPPPDLAQVRAKQILALIFQGDLLAAARALAAFRREHGPARGHLAGEEGNYADILQRWLRTPPDFPEQQGWLTFAGHPCRQRELVHFPSCRLWAAGPAWSLRLTEPEKVLSPDESLTPLRQPAVIPCIHPAIAAGRVWINTGRELLAFALESGRLLFRYRLPAEREAAGETPWPRAIPEGTVTIAEGRLYACLEAPSLLQEPEKHTVAGHWLVCFDLPDREEEAPQLRWRVRARIAGGHHGRFTGAPLVVGGRAYLLLQYQRGPQTIWAGQAYTAAEGKQLWSRELAAVSAEVPFQPRLWTQAGNLLVTWVPGSVLAVEPESGKLVWKVSYPPRPAAGKTAGEAGARLPEEADPQISDPRAPIYAADLLWVAPADAGRLLALDPATGRLLWERDDLAVQHLLGVSQGRLLFATPQGLRAVKAATGVDAGGWVQPQEGRLPSAGRGLLADGWLLWPVADPPFPCRAVDVETGQPVRGLLSLEPTRLRQLRAGQMAFGEGCLVVTDGIWLTAYVPPERLRQTYQEQLQAHPKKAALLYRLGLAHLGAGRWQEAEQYLRQAEQAFPAGEQRLQVQETRHQLLCDQARKAAQRAFAAKASEASQTPGGEAATDSILAEATAWYRQAAAADFPAPWRRRALEEWARFWEQVGRPAEAAAIWQTILREPQLCWSAMPVGTGTGRSCAGAEAAGAIARLVRQQGPASYALFEQQAAAALAQARTGADLLSLVQTYPNALAVRQALRRWARQPPEGVSAADRAQLFQVALALGQNCYEPEEKRVLLRGLARAYEDEGCWEAAQAVWQQLAESEPDVKARQSVESKSNKKREKKSLSSASDPVAVGERRWQAASEQLLRPCRGPLAPSAAELVFLWQAGGLECREAATGQRRWRRELAQPPVWLGCQADILVLADKEGLYALRLADGQLRWRWPSALEKVSPAEQPPFWMGASLVVLAADRRRLWALQPELGVPLWELPAPSADLRPRDGGAFRLYAGADDAGLLLQTTGGALWGVTAQGQVRCAAQGVSPWTGPPQFLGAEAFAEVDEQGQVQVWDRWQGRRRWTAALPLATARTGEPPRLWSLPQGLFVLVPCNLGYHLVCLDPQTGRARWPERLRLLPQGVAPSALTADNRAVYLASGRLLLAWELASGRLLWKQTLSEAAPAWQVQRHGPWLWVWPQERAWLRSSWLPLAGGAFAWPVRARLGWPFPVDGYRAADGQLVQHLEFPTTLPWGAVLFFSRQLVVGVPGTVWGLAVPPAS
jgi:outer membrane protein assembly factor BamB/tetratricopeptide (TPR) repeat protein